MKSLHVPFGFYPDAVGGTEVYVAALASALARQNHTASIAAPAGVPAQYSHAGITVHRFAVSDGVADTSELYGEGDAGAAKGFAGILDHEQPDIVHLHAFTRACSVLLVREARARRIPVVFTYHTPAVSCARGTMMLWGEQPCDGMLRVSRCTACALEGHGVPRPLARLIGHLPPTAVASKATRRGGAWTALRFSSLIRNQQAATRALFEEVDRVVALRSWVRALLIANGVPERKIISSRHALSQNASRRERHARINGPLRIAFVGRLDRMKGLDVLIGAMHLIRDERVVLDVYGVRQGIGGDQELARLRRLAGADARVTFRSALDYDAVVGTLAGYDVLAVPSQLMETGPLVVLEAFAAGVPVVGSALGGLTELLVDGVNGLLVADYRSPAAWAEVLRTLNRDSQLLRRLTDHVERPATMDQVASEMIAVYEALTAARSQRSAVPSVA